MIKSPVDFEKDLGLIDLESVEPNSWFAYGTCVYYYIEDTTIINLTEGQVVEFSDFYGNLDECYVLPIEVNIEVKRKKA